MVNVMSETCECGAELLLSDAQGDLFMRNQFVIVHERGLDQTVSPPCSNDLRAVDDELSTVLAIPSIASWLADVCPSRVRSVTKW